jgi:hypothetical protein
MVNLIFQINRSPMSKKTRQKINYNKEEYFCKLKTMNKISRNFNNSNNSKIKKSLMMKITI